MVVVEADGGEQALARLPELAGDRDVVAFVDLTMPVMEGAEVVVRLRALAPSTRFVLMSGHGRDHLERLASEVKADAVVCKPFQIADVREALFGRAGTKVAPSLHGAGAP